MCSIYGSNNRSMFDVLHDATIDRGKFVFSYLFLASNDKNCSNQLQGHPDMDKIVSLDDCTYYLGHNQAPTSLQRAFNKNTCHPFRANKWIVAHNGVLTNHKELNKKYKLKNKNPVDSSVIPLLIDHFSKKHDEIDSISKALSLLEGTFAVWIVNEQSNNVYIARQGSTLYGNFNTGSFCSINSTSDWLEVPEGKVYQLTNIIQEVGQFINSTPFFTL